jgi:hypothetical protein
MKKIVFVVLVIVVIASLAMIAFSLGIKAGVDRYYASACGKDLYLSCQCVRELPAKGHNGEVRHLPTVGP